jgi:CRISPR system Cascade subunit CasA
MNLLKDPWLPVIREDGSNDIISFWQITDKHGENPVIEIDAPGPDFRNGLYQLLIGVIQTAAMPEEDDDWEDLFHKPYTGEVLREKFLCFEDCFVIDSDGPAFMQDYDLLLDQEIETLQSLFVHLTSEPNTFFNKKIPKQIDAYWAAAALYCLCTFGPAGGRGYRTGIRGGGPVTTILIPGDTETRKTSLWEKIWFNILPESEVAGLRGYSSKTQKSDIFPWMKPTVDSSNGEAVFPQDCNPLVMYFAMPRRIRLFYEYKEGICDLTGKKTSALVTGYRTYHSGNNYQGHWIHPLTAYRLQKEKDNPPIAIKGSPGGFSYRDWMLLSFDYSEKEHLTPQIVKYAQYERQELMEKRNCITWNAGYDLVNANARGWHEAVMPAYPLDGIASLFIKTFTENALNTADTCINYLQSAVKTAWYKNPKEKKVDLSFLKHDFYRKTENDFYQLLDLLVKHTGNDNIRSQCAGDWEQKLIYTLFELYNVWALAGNEDGIDMKRVVSGRGILFAGRKKVQNTLSVMKREK